MDGGKVESAIRPGKFFRRESGLYVLGITCFGQHDSGVSLVRNGKLVFSAEEERYTRIRHDNRFPANGIQACLDHEGIGIEKLDIVAFYSDLARIPLNALRHLARYFPSSLRFLGKTGNYFEHRSFAGILRKNYGYRGEIATLAHHLSHAASTFYSSPFDDAAILSIDGTGEWVTTWLGIGRGVSVRNLRTIPFPHSLGKLYEAVTQFLGFRPNHGEGKVMGLASYGEPVFRDEFRKILRLTEDGGYKLDTGWFRYHLGDETRYSKQFVEVFGEPRRPGAELTERDMNLAASLQDALEAGALHLAKHLRSLTGATRLALAGGVALNSLMNQRIVDEAGFDEVFIFPSANDPGTSAGAALSAYYDKSGDTKRYPISHAFLGDGFSEEEMKKALEDEGLVYTREADPAEACASMLADGNITGWFQGRMEFGPRALGNRSILADPRRSEMKDIINSKVKHRESFRPFAPVVLEEECGRYFTSEVPSPYMLRVYPVREEALELIPAVTHVDGTGRVQTIRRDQNPLYHAVVKKFGELTGVPVLLNTSLNIRGEPIVRTPGDAVQAYLGSDMDALFIGPYLVRKTTGLTP